MYTWDEAEWRRKHDLPAPNPAIIQSPYRHCYPANRTELLEDAEATMLDPPAEVRACGSHWAISEAAVTNSFIVETHGLNRTLYDVIGTGPGCLSPSVLEVLRNRAQPDDPSTVDRTSLHLYHIEAGVRIFELYCRLDQGDTDPLSLAATYPELAGPWALPPIMGGAGGQTFVGALTTGTHGSGVHLPPLADAVQAIHLIGPKAKEYWLERPTEDWGALTEDAALEAVYPGIKIIRDHDVFDGVLVSAGRMGIIYSVVVSVGRQYGLQEKREATTWSDVKTWIRNHSTDDHFTANDFLQVAVNPHPRVDDASEHSAWITSRTVVPLDTVPTVDDGTGRSAPRGRVLRCGHNAGTSSPAFGPSEFTSQVCQEATLRDALEPLIKDLTEARTQAIVWAIVLPPPAGPVAALVAALGIIIDVLEDVAQRFGTLGELLATVLNEAVRLGFPEVVSRLNEFFLSSGEAELGPGEDTEISYAVMDGHDYRDRICFTSVDSLEVGFDAAAPEFVTFMETLFNRMRELHDGTLRPPIDDGSAAPPDGPPIPRSMTFGGYASFRFTKQSTALIAMQQWPMTCHIEVSGIGQVEGNLPFLKRLEADAVALSGTVHWGQVNNLNVAQVEARYPQLDRWRSALSTRRIGRCHVERQRQPLSTGVELRILPESGGSLPPFPLVSSRGGGECHSPTATTDSN